MPKFIEEVPEKGIIKTIQDKPCCKCGLYTLFVDIDFGAPICSTECQDSLWEDFKKA